MLWSRITLITKPENRNVRAIRKRHLYSGHNLIYYRYASKLSSSL